MSRPIVRSPPPVERGFIPEPVLDTLRSNPSVFMEFAGPTYQLLHYDDLQFRDLPHDLKPEHAWLLIAWGRSPQYRELPLESKDGERLKYRLPPEIEKLIHEIDAMGGHWKEASAAVAREGERFVKSALIEEAIASSIIEGVATTRQVAREMIRSGRTPRNDDERATLNNYLAMEFIREMKREPLTLPLLLRLHRIIGDGWMPSDKCGVLRDSDDTVVVDTITGELLHRPPPAQSLRKRLKRLCDLANGTADDVFVHPLVRASALHFMLGYEHPFVDGNGRTARALFHWCMLREGFRMYEYLAISRKILKATTKYPRAFRLVETDSFDLTYFLHFQLRAVRQALGTAHQYLEKKRRTHREFVHNIRRLGDFNYRQQALLVRAVNVPASDFTVRTHAFSHGVSVPTARQDLVGLEDAGLLESWVEGRTSHWAPVRNMSNKLRARIPHRRTRASRKKKAPRKRK